MLSEEEKEELILEYRELRKKYKRLNKRKEYIDEELLRIRDRKNLLDSTLRKDLYEQLLDGEEEDLFW